MFKGSLPFLTKKWGFLLCSCIAMPIAGALPGEEGDGIHENTRDSFVMLGNNMQLLGIVIGYVFVILLFVIWYFRSLCL